MIRTGTRIPEEADGAKAPITVAAVIAIIIAETSRSQNIVAKEK